jgi:DNA ligase 1
VAARETVRVPTLFDDLAGASEVVGSTTKRNAKVATLAAVLRRLEPAEVAPAVAFLMGSLPDGRIGVGWATMSNARVDPAPAPTLTVLEVNDALARLAALVGAGSVRERHDLLRSVFARSTEREQRFLVGVLGGELRQGALDGVMTSAIAAAADVPVASVRRASMLAGDLLIAASVALASGREALDALTLRPSRPVLPMLASPSADVGAALAANGAASVEWKLDGARVQAHRADGRVRLFTRNLNEVTDRLPGIVDTVSALPGGDLVLDGEALGVLDDGSPQRFQETMGDFGADAIVGRGSGIRAFFFDVMHADGASLLDEPLSARRKVLAEVVPEAARLPSIVTADPGEAGRFLDRAIAAGHEGVMVKDLERPYEAGRRGSSWRKVKPVYTFDLVVLAVEWGHGRRVGWLSNLHLGARSNDPDDTASFVMVGKTFKGLTDELLRWQTERFLSLEIGREGHVVHVRPEQVVEIAIDGVQVSTRYPGGVALRFARVKRYRDDKVAADADTIEALRAMLRTGS